MYKEYAEQIGPNDKVIIGLGDSFTQGVGAYSMKTWEGMSHPHYNVTGQYFLDEQLKNNWLTQLRDNHLPDYKIINLGINGIGNKGAVKELYLNTLPNNADVTVILMASGINRLDFIKKHHRKGSHLRWQTLWPLIRNKGTSEFSVIEKEYLENIYSPKFAAIEFLLILAEAQTFCQAKGYKFRFAMAFDNHGSKEHLMEALGDERELINIVDWNNLINLPDDDTFMELVCKLEGFEVRKNHWYNFCNELKVPSKYLTPCSHWSIEGQRVVAETIYELCFRR